MGESRCAGQDGGDQVRRDGGVGAQRRPDDPHQPGAGALIAGAATSRRRLGRRLAFAGVAYAFAVTMLGTTLPTPLYPIYEQEIGFSSLVVTIIFATYAVGRDRGARPVRAALGPDRPPSHAAPGAGPRGGLGHGLAFRAALGSVTAQSPPERRAEVSSSLFVVLYVAISFPVIGVGVLAATSGLLTAGIVFAVFVAVLALAALAGTPARAGRSAVTDPG